MTLTEAEFVQQYVLKRAGAVDDVPQLSGIVADGKRAFKMVESECTDVHRNTTNQRS